MPRKATLLTFSIALGLALIMVLFTAGRSLASKSDVGNADPKLEQVPGIGTVSGGGGLPVPLFCGTSSVNSFSDSPALGIIDNDTVTTTIDVSGVTDPVILDVNVYLDLTHSWNSDLSIFLVSPAGTRMALTTGNGGSNDDVFAGTWFDNDADIPVTDYTFANGVAAPALVPEGSLHPVIGDDPNGTWTLEVSDGATGDQGTVNSWTLDIMTMSEAPSIVNTYTVSATVGAPIDDNATVSGTLSLSAPDTYVWNVALDVDINHTFAGDLEMTLQSPAGTVNTISTDNGGGNDDVFAGTTFSDMAGDPVTDHTYSDGVVATPLTPEEAMGAFLSEDPNGDWTFVLFDDAGGDQGTLNSWALTVTTAACAPTDVALTAFDGAGASAADVLPLLALAGVTIAAAAAFVVRRRQTI